VLELKKDAFDLVHCHVFNVVWTRRDCPVVLSNATSLSWLYADGFGWPLDKVARAALLERILSRMVAAQHSSFAVGSAARVIAFTDYLAEWYVSEGVPKARIAVIPCGVAVPPSARVPAGRPRKIGFVGNWTAKGGDTVTSAYRELLRARPDAELLVVSDVPGPVRDELVAMGATVQSRLRREDLLGQWLPSIDVLAYPSRVDGLPLTLLEAMAVGLPIAVSDYRALPEVVGDGGLVSKVDDVEGLAINVDTLLGPITNVERGTAARARVNSRYAINEVGAQLSECYAQAIKDGGSV
jgi:glycosyltransferase involved in cell wall biosynthesis